MSAATPEQIRQVLDLDLGQNDSGAPTVRGYLVALLTTLWTEEDEFSGKRPFGNSGWQYDFAPAVIRAGLVEGALDEDGYVDTLDNATLNRLVLAAIASLGTDHPALLDKATSLLWDTGMPGNRQAAGELRASGGLEALT